MSEKSRRFRQLLEDPEPLHMPGGFSPLHAKLAQLTGYNSFFMAGSQTALYLYGLPDAGFLGLRDMVDSARRLASGCDIPIFSDGDTGYGNAVSVYYSVQEFIRAGVAAMSIEDQEAPKKSGTQAGRRCISVEEAVGKLQSGVAAKKELDPDFMICGRCDVIGAEGGTYDEALERSIRYVKEGGADFIWLNNVLSREQAREACEKIPAPVIPHYGGEPPAPTADEWRQIGAAGVLYPAMTTSIGLQAVWEFLNDFKERGQAAQAEWSARGRQSKWGSASRQNGLALSLDLIRQLEDQYLPKDLQRDYEHTFGHRTFMP